MIPLGEDPFDIAKEHVAWCMLNHWTPAEIIVSIAGLLPIRPTWDDAIWAIARAQDDLVERDKMRDGYRRGRRRAA